jgi:hypothetical protein
MANSWFVTVGVPGGEYACQAEDIQTAINTVDAESVDFILQFKFSGEARNGHWVTSHILQNGAIVIRKAPDELVAWLEGNPPTIEHTKDIGGWRFKADKLIVPVRHAAGITVCSGP